MAIKHTKTAVPDVDKVDCDDWNADHTAEEDPVFTAWDKDHTELTNVTSDQHHSQSHNAASHSDITSTGAQIDDAVSKKHTQNTDTALGAQTQNLDMNTHKIVGVVDPTANQEAATKKYVDDTAAPTSPAGNNGEVQFNDAGSFGADLNFFWDDTNKRLGIGTNSPDAQFHVKETSAKILIEGLYNPEVTLKQTYINPSTFRMYIDSSGNFWIRDVINNTSPFGIIQGAAFGSLVIGLTGNVGIGTTSPKSKLHVVGLPIYANNAAAITGGLTAGAFYRTNADPDPVCVVH